MLIIAKAGIFSFLSKYGADISRLTLEHFLLSIISVSIAIIIAVPLGIALTRFKYISGPILGFASVIQTIPSLALIGLVLPVLMALSLPLIGWLPALLALTLYALLPILRNTYTAISNVDADLYEAAKGIGLKKNEILFKVELPLSIPVIMAGIRTSTVICVGIASLASLVGAGGLGELIFRGLRTVDYRLMLAGAVPASLLALILDGIFNVLERGLTPKGVKLSKERKN